MLHTMNCTRQLLKSNALQQSCCCLQIRFKSPKIFAANKARNFKFIKQMIDQSLKTDRAADVNSDGGRKAKEVRPALLKGVPDVFQMSRGHAGVLKSRQVMLNSIYMQDISEILAEQDVVEQFQDINITCIEITRDLKTLKIFWNHVNSDNGSQISEIAHKFNRLKGYLHRKLIEKQKNANIPEFLFVYDEYEENNRTINELLNKIETCPDWNKEQTSFDPTEFLPPSKLISDAFVNIKPRFFKKTLTTFDPQFAEQQTEEFEQKYVEENETSLTEFQHPIDMRLNATGLDYKSLADRVLFYLGRSRNAMGNATEKITVPDSWIPPPPFSPNNRSLDNDTIEPSVEQRLDLMRRFVVEHKKKRRRESRMAMKRSMEQKELISHSLQEAEERWQSRYEETSKSLESDWDASEDAEEEGQEEGR